MSKNLDKKKFRDMTHEERLQFIPTDIEML